MPITYSAAQINSLKRRQGLAPTILLDVQVADGTTYYWSDRVGAYPAVIGAPATPQYAPKIKAAGPFGITRDNASDAGDVTIENLSGNTVRRYLSQEFRAREFYHALAVLRIWDSFAKASIREFHAVIKEPVVGVEEMIFRLVEISDPAQYFGPWEVTSEQCGVRYKGPFCGSASGLADCPRTMNACNTRAAVEHFNGIPFPTPESAFTSTLGK
ncbi:MAG TPA: hypothetical protein VN577_19955 [Terriglobales bacterium]|nr:hypothetical protein [Terriglobales bacterium]